MIYTTKELEEYEIMIGTIADAIIPETLVGFQSLYVRIYQHGKRWIDVDNAFKGILDGLDSSKVIKRGKKQIQVCTTGVENDKFFQLIIGERVFTDDKANERIEILIAPYEGMLPFVEIIDSEYGEENKTIERDEMQE